MSSRPSRFLLNLPTQTMRLALSLLKAVLPIILYYSGILRFVRHLGRHYPKIILYHSVSDAESKFTRGTDVWIPPIRFAKHLRYLRKYYNVIPLQSLVHSLATHTLPPRALVITFDDGFADNFRFAYPHLKEHNLPATVFLLSDALHTAKSIWVQEFWYLLNSVDLQYLLPLLNTFTAKYGVEHFEKDNSSPKSLRKQLEGYFAYRLSKNARAEILSFLYDAFHLSRTDGSSARLFFLTPQEIQQMRADGIAFGNHGASHTPLAALPVHEQEEEILESKNALKPFFDDEFVPFSYPFGGPTDFSSVTREIAAAAGHACILSATPILNQPSTSPHDLGRVSIGNVPVLRLAFEIEKPVLKYYLALLMRPLRRVFHG